MSDLEALATQTGQVFYQGRLFERERIIKWIEKNRAAIEIEPGENIYRDHFNSESLIAFIKGNPSE